MRSKTPVVLLLSLLILAVPCLCFGEGFAEGVSARTRNRYRAQNGIIIPPEEIRSDSWIGSFDYHYPDPESDLGVYVYNRLNPQGPLGRDGLLQIGLKGKTQGFGGLPPLNLALVVDTSATMKDGGRIEWIKDSLAKLAGKLRPFDSLALVSFDDSPRVVFESALMDSQEKIRAFTAAVDSLDPQGGTDLEAGLGMGYEQAKIHYHERSVNLVLLFSDGDEFSSRLAQAYAHSGDIRISLMWDNRNDLDLHVITPKGEEIYFHNMRDSSGGWLDVDRNVLGETAEPVENIFWYDDSAAKGEYQVWVQNYGFHEPNREPYPFRVEIKNGGEYYYYNGVVSNYGSASNKLVCTFEYQGNDTLAGIFEMAELHRQQGVSVSALGIGGNFDEELLRALAAYGQGSLREAENREDLIEIFDNDREFERIAVLAARDIEMELEFSSSVEIRGVWGL
ncbi:MAG: VWA domain-containing protein, partial [Treponema sp.]|nr:VWA domain-containing protein [Treponema sp.]